MFDTVCLPQNKFEKSAEYNAQISPNGSIDDAMVRRRLDITRMLNNTHENSLCETMLRPFNGLQWFFSRGIECNITAYPLL